MVKKKFSLLSRELASYWTKWQQARTNFYIMDISMIRWDFKIYISYLLFNAYFCKDLLELCWEDFDTYITGALKNLRKDENLCHFTLIWEDGKIRAHRVILSACSPFFSCLVGKTYNYVIPACYKSYPPHDWRLFSIQLPKDNWLTVRQDLEYSSPSYTAA